MDREKRLLRELKREVKRAGTKHRRRRLKRELAENPEEAPYAEPTVGRYRSADFNGLDRDATRRRSAPAEARAEEDDGPQR